MGWPTTGGDGGVALDDLSAPGTPGEVKAQPSRSSRIVPTQFSFPVEDHQLLDELQARGLRQGLVPTRRRARTTGSW